MIKVDPAAPPARVTRGGQEVDADLLGTEILVDPGTVEVVAAGADGVEIRRSAVAAAGQRLEFSLPAFAVLNQSPARRAVRVVTYVTGGIGLAGALVGTGFALGAVARNNDSQACLPNAPTCPARSDALTAANVATVSFAIGLPALALGTVLFIVSRPSIAAPPRSAVSFSIAPGPRGVWISGDVLNSGGSDHRGDGGEALPEINWSLSLAPAEARRSLRSSSAPSDLGAVFDAAALWKALAVRLTRRST